MTKLGWSILALILLLVAGFASLVSFGGAPPAAAPTPVAEPATTGGALPIPVAGVAPSALVDTWGQARAGGARRHDAIDIMAPLGTPVTAVATGWIEKLFDSADGGRTLYLRSVDGGTIYYYAHLDGYRGGLREGQMVRRGEAIATVGATGNADPGAPHLHFAVMRMAPGERWHQGQAVNPYPLLAPSGAVR